jgi:hypothetical protein
LPRCGWIRNEVREKRGEFSPLFYSDIWIDFMNFLLRTRLADTKVFTTCDAFHDSTNFKPNGKQKFLLSLPAAREGFI